MDIDELLNWTWIDLSWGELLIQIELDSQGVAYFSLVKLIHAIWPLNNDYWIRFPSFIFGAITVFIWSVYWMKTYGEQILIVVLMLILLMTNPLFHFVFSYSRSYSLAIPIISYFVTRFYFELRNSEERKISIDTLEATFIGVLINTHHLAAVLSFSVFVALLISRVRIIWAKPSRGRLNWCILILSSAIFFYFSIKQFLRGERILWTQSFVEYSDMTPLLLFGYGSFIWVVALVLKIMVQKFRVGRAMWFVLIALGITYLHFFIFRSLGVNLFIHRFLSLTIPLFLVMQGDILKWLLNSRSWFFFIWICFLLSPIKLQELAPYKAEFHYGPKQILTGLKKQNKVSEQTAVDCLLIDRDGSKFLWRYSTVYFGRDICTRYISSGQAIDWVNANFILGSFIPAHHRELPSPLPKNWIVSSLSDPKGIWVVLERVD